MEQGLSIQHVQQPQGSKLCGHACVAMLAGVSLAEAVDVIGHRRGTRTRELAAALRHFGLHCPFDRLRRRPKIWPPRGIVKIPHSRGRNWHWAVLADGWVYDPLLDFQIPETVLDKGDHRATSILPVAFPLPA